MNEIERPSYYAIIPASIRYCKELKFQERLFYGEITCLMGKEGYCFASNKYFADLYGVIPGTISRWISHLQQLGFITVEVIRDENKQIIERKIFIKERGNCQSVLNTYKQNCSYPYKQNCSYPISRIAKDNNINIKIDRLFIYIINNKGEIPKEFKNDIQYREFFEIIKKLEFDYSEEMINTFTEDNKNKVKIIVYCIKEIFFSKYKNYIINLDRKRLIDIYDSCKTFELKYKNTQNEINSFFDYYYASVIKDLKAKNT